MPFRRAARHLALTLPPLRKVIAQKNELVRQTQELTNALHRANEATQAAHAKITEAHAEHKRLVDENWILRRDLDWLQTIEGLRYRLSLFGLDDSDRQPATPPSAAHEPDDAFRAHFTRVLEETFFHDVPHAERDTDVHRANLYDHLEGRYKLFADSIVPWLGTIAPNLKEMTAIEVGSGTGASSLAFAAEIKQLICFEIDAKANDAARKRMAWHKLENVEIVESFFSHDADFVSQGRKANLVILCAVLEHMTTDEAVEVLRLAWQCLEPGGMLLVADTPNRFAPYDGHTSLLPLFSTLPANVRIAYASRSPRAAFRDAMGSCAPDEADMLLTRWGCGISFHEFEIALGADVHSWVALDGYEPQIQAVSSLTLGDSITRFVFDQFKVEANRAFTRTNLYFVLRKPGGESVSAPERPRTSPSES